MVLVPAAEPVADDHTIRERKQYMRPGCYLGTV